MRNGPIFYSILNSIGNILSSWKTGKKTGKAKSFIVPNHRQFCWATYRCRYALSDINLKTEKCVMSCRKNVVVSLFWWIQLISQIRYLGFTYHLVVKNKKHFLNLITISYQKIYFTPKPVESWLLLTSTRWKRPPVYIFQQSVFLRNFLKCFVFLTLLRKLLKDLELLVCHLFSQNFTLNKKI